MTPQKKQIRHLSRGAWTLAGLIALALGGLGVVLPILPTTPLVILAAYCFARGNDRLRHWLVAHRVFGPLIADWERYGSIPKRAKFFACCAMLAAFSLSLFMRLPTHVLAIQAVCLTGAAAYVLSRPTSKPRR